MISSSCNSFSINRFQVGIFPSSLALFSKEWARLITLHFVNSLSWMLFDDSVYWTRITEITNPSSNEILGGREGDLAPCLQEAA
ncbi:hypothetical protein HAX54_021905, partial [Datura stramonium]|nr:hypothetical protein [Datura stramonium]